MCQVAGYDVARELDFNEVYFAHGGNGDDGGGSEFPVGQYTGAVTGAICGALTRGVGGAAACAVAGMAVGDLVDAPATLGLFDILSPVDHGNQVCGNG